MKVKLKFESPLIIGGIKRVSNYIETLDYIPGNVLRAAFARYILNNCPCFIEDEVVEVSGDKRRNWVYFRNRQECKNCRLKNICSNFQNVKFTFFYPEGTDIIPLTTMRCKMNPEHGLIDILTEKGECPDCIKAGRNDTRVESVSGYIKNHYDYVVKKSTFTRTAVDKYTDTAKEGMLYSIEAVTGTDENDNIVFEGKIEGITKEDISEIEELRVGKYTSVGFGKCSINIVDGECSEQPSADIKETITRKMRLFSKQYIENNKAENDWNYVAVKFIADAKLNFIDQDGKKVRFDSYIDNDILKNIWLSSLNAGDVISRSYNIDKVYAEVFSFRGYDTSKMGDIREEPLHMVQKGSVIVFKSKKNYDDIFDDFTSLSSFGIDTDNGFGRFKFHFGMEVDFND